MDLHHVKARLHGQLCCLAEGVGDLRHLFLRQAGDIGPHLLVQEGPQFLHGDTLGEHAGDVPDHSLEVGVGLVELGAQFAPVGMDGVCQRFVEGKALLGVQGGAEAMRQHRYVADDDHGAASGGDLLHPLHQLLLGKAQGGGGKDDPVL